jgi:hypothetical protein
MRTPISIMPRASVKTDDSSLVFGSSLLLGRSGNLVHLGCDLVEKGIAMLSDFIDMEARSSRQKCEV